MKTLLVGLVMVGLLSGLVANRDSVMDFFSNSVEVVTVIEREVIIDGTSFTDEDAIKAAENVLNRKALEAELSGLESNFEATRATFEENKSWYEGEKERIEKELGVY